MVGVRFNRDTSQVRLIQPNGAEVEWSFDPQKDSMAMFLYDMLIPAADKEAQDVLLYIVPTVEADQMRDWLGLHGFIDQREGVLWKRECP